MDGQGTRSAFTSLFRMENAFAVSVGEVCDIRVPGPFCSNQAEDLRER